MKTIVKQQKTNKSKGIDGSFEKRGLHLQLIEKLDKKTLIKHFETKALY
ncbi:MAG TPA: hypothetical protein PLI97_07500 [Fluviicola sp.]|nr:hypothetical protein [Fluviicola sp.]